MRSIISAVAIIVSILLFFGYTKSTYDSIQATQAQNVQYDAALQKASQLEQLKTSLLSKYNSFNADDLARLQTLLPDQVNNIGLILDLDTLAHQYGLALENVTVSQANDAASSQSSAGSQGSVGGSNLPYSSINVSLTIHGTYAQFTQYLSGLEHSLRIIDLVQVGVSQGGPASGAAGASTPATLVAPAAGADSIVYAYNITLKTYWLR